VKSRFPSRRAHPRGGFHCACRRTRSLSVQIPDRASFVDRSSAKAAGGALRRGGTSLKQPARDRSALHLQSRYWAERPRAGYILSGSPSAAVGALANGCVRRLALPQPALAQSVLDARPDAFAVWIVCKTLDSTKTSRRGRPARAPRWSGSITVRTDITACKRMPGFG
jgi:hypothetical protein